MTALESTKRPLTAAERRLLSLRMKGLESRRGRSGRVLRLGAALIGILWLTTIVGSSAPSLIITGFWTIIGVALTLWILRDVRQERRLIDADLDAYRSAERANIAQVYRFEASGYVEFEEIEDEGACYAFALANGRVAFLQGQQFYPGAKFPSLDFDLVHLLDETEQPVDEHIEKRGQSVDPLRVIPAARKRTLLIPDHLDVVETTLELLENTLEPNQRAG